MKMRKIFALLTCVTMLLTVFAGINAMAATDFGKPVLSIRYDSYNATKGWHLLTVSYSGFQNFAAFVEDDNFDPNIKGVFSYAFETKSDTPDLQIVNAASVPGSPLKFSKNAWKTGGGYAYGAVNEIVTATSGDIATIYVKGAEDAKGTISFSKIDFLVSDIVAGKATNHAYSLGESTLAGESYKFAPIELNDEDFDTPDTVIDAAEDGVLVDDDDATKTIEVDHLTGKQIAIFGKNPASKAVNAGEYGIIVGGVRYPGAKALAKDQTWAIKLIAPNGKTVDGDFIGTFSVKTFFAGVESAPVTVTLD